jgi:hypothetical protein
METQPSLIGGKVYKVHEGWIGVILKVICGTPKVYKGSPPRIGARRVGTGEISEDDRREVRRNTHIAYGHGEPHHQLRVSLFFLMAKARKIKNPLSRGALRVCK